jgi:hypothetical protein
MTDETGALQGAAFVTKSGFRLLTGKEAQEPYNAISRAWVAYLQKQ